MPHQARPNAQSAERERIVATVTLLARLAARDIHLRQGTLFARSAYQALTRMRRGYRNATTALSAPIVRRLELHPASRVHPAQQIRRPGAIRVNRARPDRSLPGER